MMVCITLIPYLLFLNLIFSRNSEGSSQFARRAQDYLGAVDALAGELHFCLDRW